nr:hypothetical protein [uncultured Mucilaginibacter sp.]
MKKNYLLLLLTVAFFIIGITGCKKDEKVHTSTVLILNGSDPGINTCGWILRVNDDGNSANPLNSLKPINLDPQYETDSMRIKITYTIPDMPAIKCGAASADLPGYAQINILSVQQVN